MRPLAPVETVISLDLSYLRSAASALLVACTNCSASVQSSDTAVSLLLPFQGQAFGVTACTRPSSILKLSFGSSRPPQEAKMAAIHPFELLLVGCRRRHELHMRRS